MKKNPKKNRKHPFLTLTQYLKKQAAAKLAKSQLREEKRQAKPEKMKEQKRQAKLEKAKKQQARIDKLKELR